MYFEGDVELPLYRCHVFQLSTWDAMRSKEVVGDVMEDGGWFEARSYAVIRTELHVHPHCFWLCIF